MKNLAVLGASLGDEAKGRMVSHFSPSFQWVTRVGGSSNCGHVVYRNGKKYNHHLLPCADYRNNKIKSFLGSGMFINLEELFEEIKLAEQDFPEVGKTIYVDMDAFIVSDEHIRLDKENNKHIGSTNKGTGPANISKYSRSGTRIYHCINDNAEIIKKIKELGVTFTTVLAMREEFEKSSILFEGAQGILLDINAGTYPYVSCGDATVSGIYSSGFNFIKLDKVYGVFKPYLTKAFSPGPLPTEMPEGDAEYYRVKGGEVGNTTGKPRRLAYLDLPMLKYGIQRGGITSLIISKMDIMNGQKSIKVCTSYGKDVFSPNDFKDVQPIYIDLPGWENAKDPSQIKPFLKYIESFTKTPIDYISAGVNPEDVVEIKKSSVHYPKTDPFDLFAN